MSTSPLEVLAVVASLLAVWLSVKRHIATWPVSIVAVAAYFVVFIRVPLYADSTLQIVYLAQSVYGWWAWARDVKRAEPPVRTLTWPQRALVLAGVALVSLGVGFVLRARTNSAAPFADATLSVGSLVANQLLTRRLLENWVLWIAVDLGYVVLFLVKGLALSSGLYVVFLAMCAIGLRDWVRERRAVETGEARAA